MSSGENIAMSSARQGQSPASVCVDMWEKSSGHLANILRNSDMVAVGISFKSSGTFYCTQTFGSPQGGSGGDGQGSCAPYGENTQSPSATVPPQTDSPRPVEVTVAPPDITIFKPEQEAKPEHRPTISDCISRCIPPVHQVPSDFTMFGPEPTLASDPDAIAECLNRCIPPAHPEEH